MSEQELKPCHCGCNELQILHDDPNPCWSMMCNNNDCGWEFGWYDTKEELIEAWNIRPIEDELRNQIKSLKSEMEVHKSFHDLVVLERNQARYQRNDLRAQVEQLEKEKDELLSDISGLLQSLMEHGASTVPITSEELEQMGRLIEGVEIDD